MKKLLTLALTGILATGVLAGCGASKEDSAASDSANADLKVIKVAASATPHAEILEEAKAFLEEKG